MLPDAAALPACVLPPCACVVLPGAAGALGTASFGGLDSGGATAATAAAAAAAAAEAGSRSSLRAPVPAALGLLVCVPPPRVALPGVEAGWGAPSGADGAAFSCILVSASFVFVAPAEMPAAVGSAGGAVDAGGGGAVGGEEGAGFQGACLASAPACAGALSPARAAGPFLPPSPSPSAGNATPGWPPPLVC
eukprot:CAMPEP_0202380556 /NCGR_PEP_ID=MMETSP1127-20130417/29428_1 /ASSEMBLY_ACC=CAM_ASM_000462 /TAXON_ID=3047 /ORGANISM="Dunaliella tertiolecta, Strain CCMP1320" /LENGTH=191 /DNA_ID=CAMNT_0048979281 /DNA_START=45 /DNA_END=618 /DNA_ORIENTATION=-